jgi:hypothetical protein
LPVFGIGEGARHVNMGIALTLPTVAPGGVLSSRQPGLPATMLPTDPYRRPTLALPSRCSFAVRRPPSYRVHYAGHWRMSIPRDLGAERPVHRGSSIEQTDHQPSQ